MILSDCVCPGYELRLECTVVGGITTFWMGSAFDCRSSANGIGYIALRHSRFESGTYGSCNNGRIIARSINTTSDSNGIKYISQLIIQLDEKGFLDSKTVECIYTDGLNEMVIGMHNYTGGINY